MQQGRLAVKQERVNSQEGTPSHPPFLPLVPTAVKSLVFSAGLWPGLGSPVATRQLTQSVCGGPLLAAGSGLCPAVMASILLLVRLCQGRVRSAVTGIEAVQVGGGVRGRGGSTRRRPVWRGHRQARLLKTVVRPCPERRAGHGHGQGFRGLSERMWPGDTEAQGVGQSPASLLAPSSPHFTKL